ncbi:phosphoribosylformylglycinamidine cyclo-ligase [Patescibacteria group bacterium]|nr:phosphoribosylformylglycinamidine cyclo-ligase [Patescibacteria group bacterium]
MKNDSYAKSGVNYDLMDPFKRAAQKAARETDFNVAGQDFTALEWTRGESAFVLRAPGSGFVIGHVEEGLGTKNLVADAMYESTGRSHYDLVAQDTVAMIVNDLLTLGLAPLSVAMHLAVGSSDWFKDETRSNDLISGWREACHMAQCAWGGGETPTLKGIITPGTCLLSGSAVGVGEEKRLFNPEKIRDGDVILLIESSGIHANGLTLARQIAAELDEGYLTKLSDGRSYGETLLDPTHIYVLPILECLNAGIDIHYAVNITGHGWAKLMRATQAFTYVIDALPEPKLIFPFLQKHGKLDDREAYKTLNMGAGYALYVPENTVDEIRKTLATYSEPYQFKVTVAGHIEKSEKKRVLINPLNISYDESDLAVR